MTGRPDFETTHTAAWLDLGYDRDYASDRKSRYGAYLRDRARWWDDDDPDSEPGYLAARTATRCWEIANGPIMAPPLVALHPRILSARASTDDYDGQLVLTVELVTGLPDGLRGIFGYRWRSWQHDQYGPAGPAWVEPYDHRGGPTPTALPRLTLSWPVPADQLPPAAAGVPAVADAIDTVTAVGELLNGELRPVLTHLDGAR